MKKALLTTSLILCCGLLGHAQYFSDGTFNYQVLSEEESTCMVTGLSSYMYATGEVVIPSTVAYDGQYSIVEVGGEAFKGFSEVTSFVFPETLQKIGESSFSGCTGLTSLVFPEDLQTVGYMAFDECSNITAIHFGGKIESIDDYAFGGLNSLKSIECGATVPPSIGEDTFSWMLDKSSVTLTVPAGSAEAYSQSGWKGFNIQEVEKPYEDSVEIEGIIYGDFTKEAPYTCSVTGHLDDLNQLGFTIYSTVAANGVEYSVKTVKEAVFKGYQKVYGEVIIEDGVENIESEAFNGFYAKSIKLPTTLKKIGFRAFYGCMALESIEIPGSVTEISEYAFAYCKKLGDVVIGEGTLVIGSKCFFSCSSLKTIVLPASLETIQNNAFESCNALSGITLPENLSTIGSSAFYGCDSITEIKLPTGLTEIADGLFAYSGISKIEIPASISRIGSGSFEYCTQLENLDIPGTVTEIEINAFSNCEGLTSLTLNEGIESIGDNAFYECILLDKVVVPSSVVSVGRSAFNGCSSLTNAEIYSENIEGYGFVRCTALKDIVLGGNMRNIKESAFAGSDLQTVEVMATEPPVLDPSAFNNATYEKATLKVPSGSIDAYKEADGWKKFNLLTTGIESVSDADGFKVRDGVAFFNDDATVKVVDLEGRILLVQQVESGESVVIPGNGLRIIVIDGEGFIIK